jgi:hypothetical protein
LGIESFFAKKVRTGAAALDDPLLTFDLGGR